MGQALQLLDEVVGLVFFAGYSLLSIRVSIKNLVFIFCVFIVFCKSS